jgi:hypothetical protein
MTERRGARLVLALLLLLCAAAGWRAVHGLTQPHDLDNLRDLGFIQGILDGNWFGDPVYAGEARWYPGLIAALAAAAYQLLLPDGTPLAAAWVQAGPWLNLLAPPTFFWMARRVLGSFGAAAAATAAFVLWSGNAPRPWLAPWDAAGYTPWPFTPNLALPLFFLGVGLAHRRCRTGRRRDAAAVGSALGVAFLAHPVAGLLLSGIVTAAAFAAQGVRRRTVAWLAAVAAVQLAWALLFLGPVAAQYALHTANAAPAGWLSDLMRRESLKRVLILNAPGVLAAAAAAAAFLRRRRDDPAAEPTADGPDRRSVAILAAWTGICVLFLLRHYACMLAPGAMPDAACRVTSVPPHHYHFYLQAGWACVIGFAGWAAGRRIWASGGAARRAGLAAAVLLAAATGAAGLLNRPYDRVARQQAERDGVDFDRDAYAWILAETRPADLFVTELKTDWGDPAAFSVYAAGRRLVAAPKLHSNPYVAWEPRDARRQLYLAAADEGDAAALCGLAREAASARGGRAWLLLPNERAVAAPTERAGVEPVFRSAFHTAYRVVPDGCAGAAAARLR